MSNTLEAKYLGVEWLDCAVRIYLTLCCMYERDGYIPVYEYRCEHAMVHRGQRLTLGLGPCLPACLRDTTAYAGWQVLRLPGVFLFLPSIPL